MANPNVPAGEPGLADQRLELILLGVMLRDRNAAAEAAGALDPTQFSDRDAGLLFAAARDCVAAGSLDPIALADRLRELGQLEQVGGLARVAGLVDGIPQGIWVATLVRSIQSAHARRRAAQAYTSGLEQLKAGRDWRGVAMSVADEVAAIQDGVRAGGFQEAGHGAHAVLEAAVSAGEAESGGPGVDTGLVALDSLLLGLQPGDLFYMAARPSQGKTSFLDQVVLNVARTGRHVAVFSLEMTRAKQVTRLLANMSGIDSNLIRAGTMSPGQWLLLMKAAIELRKLPIWIDDSRPMTIGQIAAKSRRLKSEVGQLDLIGVDYVQLIRSSLKRVKSDEENSVITEVSHGLKDLAGELGVPVLALSQMNRAIEQGKDRRPQLSDLRGSGSLEQDADNVGFLYRAKDEGGSDNGQVEIILAKSRDGKIGTVTCPFVRHLSMFVSGKPEILPV